MIRCFDSRDLFFEMHYTISTPIINYETLNSNNEIFIVNFENSISNYEIANSHKENAKKNHGVLYNMEWQHKNGKYTIVNCCRWCNKSESFSIPHTSLHRPAFGGAINFSLNLT